MKTLFFISSLIGPLELGMVMLMVTLELGILPALAGVATMLLLIPIQAALVRPVGNIRKNNAQKTDERVRLASEVIQGSLAMKMLRYTGVLYMPACLIVNAVLTWRLEPSKYILSCNVMHSSLGP